VTLETGDRSTFVMLSDIKEGGCTFHAITWGALREDS
jgi:hypothetical protein